MKKVSLIMMIALMGTSCADKKAQKKALIDSVFKIHERVMTADERLMSNKMMLDSLVKHETKKELKDSAAVYLAQTNHADSIMMDWMHQFDPDQPGKSDNEKIKYFTAEKKRIMAIDSQVSSAVSKSNNYLAKMKTK